MNKQTRQAIAYVQDALTFLFLDATLNDSISKIFLYGSAVRGQLRKESDLDLFIDCASDQEKIITARVRAAFARFYQSKDYQKWKDLRFSYPLSVHAGELEQWQLHSSIMAEGILLYSKKAELQPGERHDLFILEFPKAKKKYLRLVRSLFGRKEKGYQDSGFLGKLHGKKLSSNVILIKKEQESQLLAFFQKEKINYSFKEIGVFE